MALICLAYLLAFALMFLLGKLLPGMKAVIYGFNFLLGVISATLVKAVINLLKKKKVIKKEYVNDYKVVIKEADNGLTVKQKKIWSDYYFYNMPETLSIDFDDLKADTDYIIELIAGSFWDTYSAPLKATTKTLK